MRLAGKKILLLMLAWLLPALASALNVTGKVIDADTAEPLIEAAVKLLAARDSAFVKGVTTDDDGRFRFTDVNAGKYILSIAYIGYADYEAPVTVGTKNLRLGEIKLKESSTLLSEVQVVAVKTPIKVMEDTVEYNADSYRTQPNAVVEDLLKRLPGVEVGSDGSITANGKTISKILVDGKEFFADDPKVASKNLPASMIDKLQVVDRKSDEARLTGVDDGEDETVINLSVKKGMNQGWFGTVTGGYGTDDRYAGSFNINRFWNGNQLTFLGNLNNINEMGFTDSNGGRFRRFGGDNGITVSRAAGLNFNVGNGEIFRVGGNVIFTNTDNISDTRQNRQELFEDYSTYTNSTKYSRNRGNNVSGQFRMLWKPNEYNTLEFRPNFSFNHNNSFNDEWSQYLDRSMREVYTADNVDRSRGNSWEASGRLIYSHSFKEKKGRSFSISAQYQMSNVRETEKSISNTIYNSEYMPTEEDVMNDDIKLDQYGNNHTWSNSVNARVTYTEPLGDPEKGHALVFAYRFNYRWNNADKLTYDLPDGYEGVLPPLGAEPNPDYSNSFRNESSNQSVQVGYKKSGKKLNFEGGLQFVPQMSKSENLIDDAKTIPTRWVWNYAPYLRLRYKLDKQSSFQVFYRGRSSQPSMTQLQPVADISDPMNIKQGNPDLDPSFTHNFNLRFQDYNADSQRSIMLMLNGSFTQNSIVSLTTVDPVTAVRTTTYTNVNGVWSARLMNMFNQPLRNKKWNISNHIFANVNHNVGFNNGARNNSLSFTVMESPGITFRPDHFELELRPEYRLQLTKNSLPQQRNQTVHSYGGRFDGTYYTSWGFNLQTDLRYSATTGMAAGYDTKTLMWNASISQQVLRDKSLTIALKVHDLLNQTSNIRRNVTANYIDDIEYNSLTRYFMVTLTWKFNTFGKGNTPSVDGGDMGPGGPGRGFGGPGGPGGGRPPR